MHRRKSPPPEQAALMLGMLVVMFWGTAATAFKIALRSVTPYQLLVWSVFVSLVVLAAAMALRGGYRGIARLPPREVAQALLLGALNPFLYYLVLFAAYDRLPGQIAMSLNYAWPLVLALLAVPILGQRLTARQLVAIGISFFGAVLIVTGGQIGFDSGLDPIGVLLALGSTLIWAVFWLVNARSGADPVVKLLLGFASGATLAVAASPLSGGLTLPPPDAWPALAYIGLFEMGVTFVLWLSALQLTRNAARLGQMIYLAPFLSLLILNRVIGEPIQPTTPVGMLLIVGAILWRAGDRTQGLQPRR